MSEDSLINDEESNEEKLQTTTSIVLTNTNSKIRSISSGKLIDKRKKITIFIIKLKWSIDSL